MLFHDAFYVIQTKPGFYFWRVDWGIPQEAFGLLRASKYASLNELEFDLPEIKHTFPNAKVLRFSTAYEVCEENYEQT